jgi:hypothetical protein
VWIPGDDSQQFLVPAGGRLYVVGPKSKKVDITPGLRTVRSVSVSPDGRRVALAAGGKAYVAGLEVDSAVRIDGPLREIVPARMNVAAVAWASENRVLVAGSQGTNQAALFRASPDGAIAVEESPNEAGLTDIIAFPDRTLGPSGLADTVAQTADAVFRVYGNRLQSSTLVRPFYAG